MSRSFFIVAPLSSKKAGFVDVRVEGMGLVLAELTVQASKRRVVLLEFSAMLTVISVAALIVSACLLLHVASLMFMAEWLLRRREYLERSGARMRYATTIGYGDVLLPQRWRLLGAIEGVTGVLLCGISTAFFFAIMTAMFQIRIRQLNQVKAYNINSVGLLTKRGHRHFDRRDLLIQLLNQSHQTYGLVCLFRCKTLIGHGNL